MRSQRKAILTVLVILSTLFAACAGAAAPAASNLASTTAANGTPQKGGEITVVYKDDLATLDPAIGYDWKASGQSWNVTLNVKNITNEVYFPANQARGKPRQFILTVGTKF